MYQYIKKDDGSDRSDMILRVADNAFIPNDVNNRDWQDYQAWLAADPENQPLPSA